MSRERFSITLNWSKNIAAQVKHFSFTRADHKAFCFIPGQFITLHISHADKVLRRSYSIANSPDGSAKIEFAASYVSGGIASDLLFNLKPGDQLEATGPFGRLILLEPYPKRIILVATGTGVTPYRSMLPDLEKYLIQATDRQLVLLLGVREAKDLLYRDEFVTYLERHPRFHFRVYYSRLLPEQPLSYEYRGYLLDAFRDIHPDINTDIVYLCGNPNMVDQVFSLLMTRGFTTQAIRREKYISS